MTEIFVFGSNLAGRHGKGAALYARHHYNAQYGEGRGPTGNAYAIPTKDEGLKTLPLSRIKTYVDDFIKYARANPNLMFKVTAVGCGLAGYRPEQIAPMFNGAPLNCIMPDDFKNVR